MFEPLSVEEAIARLVRLGYSDEEVFAFFEGPRPRWWGDERRGILRAIHQARGKLAALAKVEQAAAAVWEEPDGPTQEKLAEKLGWTARYVSSVTSPFGGYRTVMEGVKADRK